MQEFEFDDEKIKQIERIITIMHYQPEEQLADALQLAIGSTPDVFCECGFPVGQSNGNEIVYFTQILASEVKEDNTEVLFCPYCQRHITR